MDGRGGQSEAQLLSVSIQDVQASAMCALATAVIVLYDCALSIDREIELVWKKRWSLIKVVYLWYRYFGIFCVLFEVGVLLSRELSDSVRAFFIRWEASCYTTLTFVSEAVLILWIWVAYNRNRKLLISLSVIYAVQVVSVITILIQSLYNLQVKSQTVAKFALCRVTQIGHTLKFLWVPILGFDFILLALFTYKGFHVYWSRTKRERFGVMYMVYKHTIPTFLAIVSSYLMCAVMWLTARRGLGQIPESFALCFSVINCTRLLLNIRRAYYIGSESAQPTPLSSFTGLSRMQAPESRRHRRDSLDSISDFEQAGELAVAVHIEVTRTCEEFGVNDWEYEMSELRSATI